MAVDKPCKKCYTFYVYKKHSKVFRVLIFFMIKFYFR